MHPDRAHRPPAPATPRLAVEERNGNPHIRLSLEGGTAPVRLSVEGELDVATAPALAARLDQLQADRIDVRLDLSNVGFIDSSGIAVLLATTKRARDDSRWKFEVEPTLHSHVRRVLRAANVEEFILGAHHGRAA